MMANDNVFDLQAWKGKLQTSKQGVKKSITNLMLFLDNMREFGPNLRWNELAYRAEWNGRPIDDADLISIRLLLEGQQFEPSVADVLPAVIAHAKRNSYHPVREYLDSLEWDGKKRLDIWLQNCLGAPESAFTRIAGRKSLIAAVARAFDPGCKVDTVLILEGPQGIKKSTAIKRLFSPAWTAESVNLFDQHNKMVMAMMGAWCVEISEFVAVLGRNQDHVKGLLSMQTDKVTLPYAKISSEHPRQCIFIGTINPGETGYFTDGTGNRRYWPVPVTKADLHLIDKVRDQIWAEAVTAYKAQEAWWLETREEENLARVQTAAREEVDPWDEILTERLVMNAVHSTTIAAALQAIGVPFERMDKKAQNRVADCLRRVGYESRVGKVIDGDGVRRSARIFYRSEGA